MSESRLNQRMIREKQTIESMVRIFCGGNHRTESRTCPECEELLDYALTRLEKCPLTPDKPTCAKCPVHCYKPEMRNRIKEVMRFSGPRMLARHPILAVLHLLDSRRGRKEPKRES